MAVKSAQVSVGTTATSLAVTSDDDLQAGVSVGLRNAHASASVFIGGATVTTGTGFELTAGASIGIDLAPGESLYGIVASGTVTVGVLREGVA